MDNEGRSFARASLGGLGFHFWVGRTAANRKSDVIRKLPGQSVEDDGLTWNSFEHSDRRDLMVLLHPTERIIRAKWKDKGRKLSRDFRFDRPRSLKPFENFIRELL